MDQQKKKEMGKRIRAWREKRGYTREQLSGLSALSPRFIANIESGDTSISLDSLIALCRALSCSILFGGEVQPEAWAEEIACLQNLPVKYQPEISRMLQSVTELILAAEPKRK